MRTSTLIGVLGLILGLGVCGCSDSTDPSPITDSPMITPIVLEEGAPCGDPLTVTLYAPRSIDVGHVTVFNSTDHLVIRIEATGGWVLVETHAAVAISLDEIPQSRSGNPKVGRFGLSANHDPPVTCFEYQVDCAYDAGQELFLAVQADVQLLDGGGNVLKSEGAWADGPKFPGNGWATYFHYIVESCQGQTEIIVTIPAASVCQYDPFPITWGSGTGESLVRIELLCEDGSPCSIIAAYADDTGMYAWDAIGWCDDESMPGTYRIGVLDLCTGARGESSPFIIEDCGGWEE